MSIWQTIGKQTYFSVTWTTRQRTPVCNKYRTCPFLELTLGECVKNIHRLRRRRSLTATRSQQDVDRCLLLTVAAYSQTPPTPNRRAPVLLPIYPLSVCMDTFFLLRSLTGIFIRMYIYTNCESCKIYVDRPNLASEKKFKHFVRSIPVIA